MEWRVNKWIAPEERCDLELSDCDKDNMYRADFRGTAVSCSGAGGLRA